MNPVVASVERDILQRLSAAMNRNDAGAVTALCCDDVMRADPAGQQREESQWNS